MAVLLLRLSDDEDGGRPLDEGEDEDGEEDAGEDEDDEDDDELLLELLDELELLLDPSCSPSIQNFTPSASSRYSSLMNPPPANATRLGWGRGVRACMASSICLSLFLESLYGPSSFGSSGSGSIF